MLVVLLHRLKPTISLPVFIIFSKFFNLIIATGQLRFHLAVFNISEHGINNDNVSNPIKSCYCINGGKCIGSKCVCPLGYWGENCEKCIPNSRCKGFCRRGPGECTCPFGKGGQFCEKDLVFCTKNSPCQNGGICQNNAEGNYTCKCIPGFGGRNCERKLTKCEEEPCYNGAKCIPSFSYPGFRCLCPSLLGLYGRFCEIKAPNGCLDLPCQNGGSCIDYSSNTVHNNSFKCICPEGWTGPLCEVPWGYCSENPCQNGGTCVTDNLNEKGYVCFCKPGWSGVNCEDKINNCLINPCLNGGICFNSMNAFRCYCTNQWEGEICQNRIQRQLRDYKHDHIESSKQRNNNNYLFNVISLLLALIALLLAFLSLLYYVLRFLLLFNNSNNLRMNKRNVDLESCQNLQQISFIYSRYKKSRHFGDISIPEYSSPRYISLPVTQNNKTTNSNIYEEINYDLSHQNI
uniref:EGF-like domain-containing protein n=1 Tax=Meloidogyne enterolobii TaxID=390850 RepID=A0A6V7VR47_MELEN|nr:unnamed protein product [Meloidogyne enterolobii]